MSSLIDLFYTEDAAIKPFLRMAGGGEPVYGPVEIRKCRFELGAKIKTVHKYEDGQVDVIPAQALMFCSGPSIPADSIVTLRNHDYKVINCDEMQGFCPHHLEVMLN